VSTHTQHEHTNPSGAHEPVFPKRVNGTFRHLKWWLMFITLGIYYVTPWLRWDRGPNLPNQGVLIDLAHRRFYFFMIEIWPYEFYFVAGLLIMAGLGLFLFTSAAGRVWCGYACPQTIWTDLYVMVERWVEGDRNARIRLHRQKWNLHKARLRFTKWAIWLLIGLATGGAWVFYFADAPTIFLEIVTLKAPFVAYGFILTLTATTFIFGGFLRDQICTYMCPWPRIQAAMMDEDTMTITYREWRGEPRGAHRKGPDAAALGDCIDCKACVAVCPMGIDIRDGSQLECITCGLCIDACDEMMVKVGKPTGLIGYMTANDEPLERAGNAPRNMWKHLIRPRTLLYFGLWAAVGAALVVALFVRSDIEINITPVRSPVFITQSDGTIRNAYDVRLLNKFTEDKTFHIAAKSLEDNSTVTLELQRIGGHMITVPADATLSQRVYLDAAPDQPAASQNRTRVRIWIEILETGERVSVDTIFNGKTP